MLRVLNPDDLPEAPVRGLVTHWTGAGYSFDSRSRARYHFGIEKTGDVKTGRFSIINNCSERLLKGRYAAHTRSRSGYRVGLAVCGMAGAVAEPFDPGRAPFTLAQWEALAAAAADVLQYYRLPVTERTCSSRFEQEGVWGGSCRQRGRWDISRLPWAPELEPVEVAALFRNRVRELLEAAPAGIRLLLDGEDLTLAGDPVEERGLVHFWLRPVAVAAGLTVLDVSERAAGILTPEGKPVTVPLTMRAGRGFVAARDFAGALGWRLQSRLGGREVLILRTQPRTASERERTPAPLLVPTVRAVFPRPRPALPQPAYLLADHGRAGAVVE